MDEVYVAIYEEIDQDGNITVRMFDIIEPSLEYIELFYFGGYVEVFTN